jgi:hypothetical protein
MQLAKKAAICLTKSSGKVAAQWVIKDRACSILHREHNKEMNKKICQIWLK